jgi:ubiquinone/menaquinone biosynthesis C-methylase UbiE
MDRPDYDRCLYKTYVPGRELSDPTMTQWMESIAPFVPESSARILDLGSGAGRFTRPLAEHFSAWVIGAEPSAKMREQESMASNRGQISSLGARAEQLPLAAGSVDVVFASMVIHYIAGIEQVGSELRRVLRSGGSVLIRNSFRGRLDSIPYHRFFPGARALDEARLPAVEEVVFAFAASGLEAIDHKVVRQQIDRSLADHLERLRLRAISTLALLPDEQFASGIERMERAIEEEDRGDAVWENIDLLVFQKRP